MVWRGQSDMGINRLGRFRVKLLPQAVDEAFGFPREQNGKDLSRHELHIPSLRPMVSPTFCFRLGLSNRHAVRVEVHEEHAVGAVPAHVLRCTGDGDAAVGHDLDAVGP